MDIFYQENANSEGIVLLMRNFNTVCNILFMGNRYIYCANLLRFLQVKKLLFIKNPNLSTSIPFQ
jgi:hypothetical protein